MAYAATPDEERWEVRRLGGTGSDYIRLPVSAEFPLGAYSDGLSFGEFQISAGLRLEDGDVSFFRSEDADADPTRLIAISGAARTRQPAIWVLTGSEVPVEILDPTLVLAEPEPCEGGALWRVEGSGRLRVGRENVRIDTSAEADAPHALLRPVGDVLPGWRRAEDGSQIMLGDPTFVGVHAGGVIRRLTGAPQIESRTGGSSRYGERIYSWRPNGEVVARVRLTMLGRNVRLDLDEARPGAVNLKIQGLPPGLHVGLRAGKAEKSIRSRRAV